MKRILTSIGILASIGFLAPIKSQAQCDWLKITGSHRARIEATDNTFNFDDNKASNIYTRNRSSVMFQVFPTDGLEIGLRITNEFRNYLSPKMEVIKKGDPKNLDTLRHNWSEAVFDNLYAKYTVKGDLPMAFTLGRFNMAMGENFIIFDGTPGDGSRTGYFNGLRADLGLAKNHNLTLFGSYVPRYDSYLPVIGDKKTIVVEQNETGAGAYYTGKFQTFTLDGYGIYREKAEYDYHDNKTILPDYKGETFGFLATTKFTELLSGSLEAAYQVGKYKATVKGASDIDQSAYAGQAHLDYDLSKVASFLKKFTIGGYFYSGDDPTSKDKNEAWEPVYGRYPKWSESYIYALSYESQTAYWSNLNSFYATLNFCLGDNTDFYAEYQRLGSQYSDRILSTTKFGYGTFRGDLLQFTFKYKVNQYLTGHLVWDNLRPGTFYFKGADRYQWVRFEMNVAF